MSITQCPNCNTQYNQDTDVEHEEMCGDFEPTWQEKFNDMFETADRIIARGKLIEGTK